LSLRQPQQDSLRALAVAISASEKELLNPKRDLPRLLETLKAQFPKLSDFERDFPSLCFALATGVGKTRLMGAFITHLYQMHGIRNYFVLAPN
ncbi:DEAD/DEAH box helicase family protein, partial [Shewanella sp. T24-MNA-CIBAN-0130]